MLFVSLPRIELNQDDLGCIGGVELRLDMCDRWDRADIANFLFRSAHPVMLTLRKRSQGGKFTGTEEERERKILDLLALEPEFFDLEYDMRPEFLQKAMRDFPKTKCILSYHNFERTPVDLDPIFRSMENYPAYGYKICAYAHSAIDALRMLVFGKKHSKASVICMGEKGEFARVLGPVAGNRIDYACIHRDASAAPGQLTVSEMTQIYRYHTLDGNTEVFGLIGDPVDKSRGHIYHNAVFANQKRNAVYVKIAVKAEELPSFFSLAKEFGFKGLSVTMPLKEAVFPFLDACEENGKAIGSVNTILFKEGKIYGSNTDGKGALDAIEKKLSVRNKVVVLIGAGGAARGIAWEAIQRGAIVWVLNRTVQRAEALGKLLGCNFGALGDLPSSYDVIINCTPDPTTLDLSQLKRGAVAMDIVSVPKETPFIQAAKHLGGSVVYGEEMFYNQAAAQTLFWQK